MNNLIINKINEKELSEVLNQWFNQNQLKIIGDKGFWRKNPVAKIIKTKLKSNKRWKDRARGKAVKGQWTKPNPAKDDW
jgi:hypothetical protein